MRCNVFNGFILGDEIYPSEPDYEGLNCDADLYADKTLEELRNMYKNIHRMEIDEKGTRNICNIVLPNGHLNPLYDGVTSKKSKL